MHDMSDTMTTSRRLENDARSAVPHGREPAGLRGQGGGAAPNRLLHRVAQVTVATTFLLILAGGNVTSKQAGLAVPDWPLSFGSVNPEGWTQMPLVRDEHFHRLVGATVGLLAIVLAVGLWIRDQRQAVRWLGVSALLAVIVQGVMGGLRVTELSLTLAIVHGVFGQIVFCLLVALAAVLSPRWPGKPDQRPEEADRALRGWSLVLVLVILGQLVLGALLRHKGVGAIWHIMGAMVVGVALLQVFQHVFNPRQIEARLGRSAITILVLFGLQLVLGVMAFLIVTPLDGAPPQTRMQAYLPTLHVGLGAVILAMSFHLALRAWAMTGSVRSLLPRGTGQTAREGAAFSLN